MQEGRKEERKEKEGRGVRRGEEAVTPLSQSVAIFPLRDTLGNLPSDEETNTGCRAVV